MKRNLFPFLGIAFVVAIAATGVFYGLFVGRISGAAPAAASPAGTVVAARAVGRGQVLATADVRLLPAGSKPPEGTFGSVDEVVGRTAIKSMAVNDPVVAGGLAGAKGAAELTIPKGMRAMSIRVADSTGLVPYLRAGNRIDVQSIYPLHSGQPPVRTLLSNVEVLNVHADASPQPVPGTVLNLLVPASDVERVALADSVAKVRFVLRNGEDKPEQAPTPLAHGQPKVAVAGPRVSFHVRMAAAAGDTLREIAAGARLATGGDGAIRIGLLPIDWKVESLRILSSETVLLSQWQEVSVQAGGTGQGEYNLRLRLMTRDLGNGLSRVRIRPELTLPQRGGISSRRFSADLNVAEGQSVLVSGFEKDVSTPALIEKLFRSPTPHTDGSELLVIVTPSFTPRFAAARQE